MAPAVAVGPMEGEMGAGPVVVAAAVTASPFNGFPAFMDGNEVQAAMHANAEAAMPATAAAEAAMPAAASTDLGNLPSGQLSLDLGNLPSGQLSLDLGNLP